ncbi:MAG: YbaB/EbfC family nucleoid-associated protein [Phycisphaerae bacterium]|nr:YbaB/EbfC family nucleoid-associated protein [Phycisphaerae bacterium]
MFDNLKAMGAVAGLLRNQDKLKASAERVRARLAQARVEGQSGGGAVHATVDGQLKVVSIVLSPALAAGLADAPSRERAGALVAQAVNSATERARLLIAQEVSREADELGLPPEMLQGLRGLMP